MFRKAAFFTVFVSLLTASVPAQTGISYPKAKKAEQVDTFHGTTVADPYRWMEETTSADTQAWIEEQNKITNAYFETIPERAKIKARLTELWNYERYGAPAKIADGFYIYTKNDGLQNQSVWYRAKSIDDPGTVFFDPNKLSTDGTVALSGSS